MSVDVDYYRVLHVQRDAPTALIHASYRTLLARLEQATGADSRRTLESLQEAYAVLTDPARRAAYDLARATAASRLAIDGDTRERTGEHFGAVSCLFCGRPHGLTRALRRSDECGECASPLFPAERHRLEYSGQRMLKRIAKRQPIRLYTGWPQAQPFAAEMRDISLNGMQLSTPQRLPIDQIVKIDSDVCQSLARIAHCERDAGQVESWTVGVEFLTLRFAKSRGSFVSARV